MNKYALIMAGGKGLRMGSELPKQFLPIAGKPILMHTLDAFYTYDPSIQLILVLPEEQQSYWAQLCKEAGFTVPHSVVTGGDTRFQSVKNGLDKIQGPGLVGVHDGVRPFVSPQVLARCYTEAALIKAVVPVAEITETVRLLDGDTSQTVNRDKYKLVQTPQVFDIKLLKRAYEQDYRPSFTDDASVVEELGVPVYLTEGNRENIKITTPFDLKIAGSLLSCSI